MESIQIFLKLDGLFKAKGNDFQQKLSYLFEIWTDGKN